jgi:chitinase
MTDRTPPLLLAYLGSWGDWQAETIDAAKLTHLNYAFAHVKDGRVVPSAEANARERLAQVRRLKALHPHLQILISVGGWGAEGFSDAALSAASRATFADSALAFAEEHGFDGVDLDWEYPSNAMAGIKARPEDRRNFTLLLEATKKALGGRYPLTIAAGAQPFYLEGIETGPACQLCDFVNLMTYDLYNGWSKVSGHHANLFRSKSDPAGDSADRAVELFAEQGVPAAKLVIGAAFYGRGMKGAAPVNQGLMQATTPESNFTKTYAEIKSEFSSSPRFERHWDAEARAPWLYDGDTFLSYEDPESLRHKARFVHERGLRGVMFWEYTQDHGGELLGALHAALRS